jgi:hypothetical protein
VCEDELKRPISTGMFVEGAVENNEPPINGVLVPKVTDRNLEHSELFPVIVEQVNIAVLLQDVLGSVEVAFLDMVVFEL